MSSISFQKSIEPFLRIEIFSDNPEVYLRPFIQPRPTKIIINNGFSERFDYDLMVNDSYYDFTPGYKRFKDITIKTKEGSQKVFIDMIYILICILYGIVYTIQLKF